MPKPGKHNKPNWKAQYIEHDCRSNEQQGGNIRRVNFKPNRYSGGKGSNKDWGASLRSHLEDEDIDMGTNNFNARNKKKNSFGKKGNRQGSPLPHHNEKRRLLEGPTSWYRITLPYGTRYDKELILKMLLEKIAPLQLTPIAWYANGNAVTFYVDDYAIAQKLHSIDRELKYPDGYKMIIKVLSGTPSVDVSATMKEKMKLAMAKRYNAMTKALDLTRFHVDPDLLDMFCALFKPVVFLQVIDIMAENIPEMEALNLNDNKLQLLSHLKGISKKLPNLKILHMGNNKIRDIAMLDYLQGLPVVDLVLDGNPLCDKFKDKEKYISEVRKRFPKVIKLDGLDLPPPIVFDVEEDIPLPPAQQTFLCLQDGQSIVRQFLEAYFQIYDSDSRQPLLQAYHENAMYSMTMCYPYGMHQKNSSNLSWYGTDNRNILRVQDPDRRNKMLRQGQLAVVSFLNEVPATKHDMNSFTVDLTLFTPQMLLLTVSGMFKEIRSGLKNPPIRFFFRTMIIVPAGTGFCIANEELHITNATEEQAKFAFKTPPLQPQTAATSIGVQPAVCTVTTPTTAIAPVSTGAAPIPDEQTKQQMVQAISQQSGMNLEWSKKCLEESNWDFQRAGFVFTELHKQNIIPPEAFAK